MTKTDFQKKLDQASEIVESWPEWRKNSLRNSFKSRNAQPREPVKLQGEETADTRNKPICE